MRFYVILIGLDLEVSFTTFQVCLSMKLDNQGTWNLNIRTSFESSLEDWEVGHDSKNWQNLSAIMVAVVRTTSFGNDLGVEA